MSGSDSEKEKNPGTGSFLPPITAHRQFNAMLATSTPTPQSVHIKETLSHNHIDLNKMESQTVPFNLNEETSPRLIDDSKGDLREGPDGIGGYPEMITVDDANERTDEPRIILNIQDQPNA